MSISIGDLLLKISADKDAWGFLKETIQETKGELSTFADDVHDLGKKFDVGFTAPITLAGGLLVKFGSDFEEARNKIVQGTGATGEALEAMMGSVQSVFANGDDAIEDVAETVAQLNQVLGLTGPDLEAIASQFLDLADITGEELAPMVDEVTHAFTSWQVATEDQARTLDFLMQVSMASGQSVTQLAQQLIQYGPILRNLGISFQDATLFIANLARAGVEVGPVIAGIQQAMLRLSKEGFKEPLEALQALEKGIRGAASSADAIELAAGVFGKATGSIVDAIRNGKLSFDSFAGSMQLSGRSVAETANEMKTLGQALSEIHNMIAAALMPIGADLVDIFRNILEAMKPMIEMAAGLAHGFSQLPPSLQAFIASLAALLAAAGPVLHVLAEVGTAGTALMAMFPALATAAGGSGLAASFILLANSVSIAGAAFTGWQLGAWLDRNVPAMHRFGEAVADLVLKIPGMKTAFGVVEPNMREFEATSERLEKRIRQLEYSLGQVGVIMGREVNETMGHYIERLRKVAEQHGILEKAATSSASATSASNKAMGAATAEGKDLERQLAAIRKAFGEHDKAAEKTQESLVDLSAGFAFLGDQSLPGLARQIQINQQEMAKANAEWEKTVEGIERISDEVAKQVSRDEFGKLASQWIDGVTDISKAFDQFSVDTKLLGVTTISELRTQANLASEEFRKMGQQVGETGQSIFTTNEMMQAEIGLLEKQVALKKALGEETQELEDRIFELKVETGQATTEMMENWVTFTEGMRGTFENFSHDLASAVWNGDIAGALNTFKTAFLQTFQDLATSILQDFIEHVLLGDLQGAINSIGESVTGLGDIFQRVFGGTVASGAGQGAQRQVAQTIQQGLMNTINMVTGVISAFADLFSFLQGRRMEKDIGRIEVTTRGMLNELLNRRDDAWKQHNAVAALLAQIYDNISAARMPLDAIWVAVDEIRNILKAGGVAEAPAPAEAPEALESDRRRNEVTQENTEAIDNLTDKVTDVDEGLEDVTDQIYTDVGSASDTLANAAKPIEQATQGLKLVVDSLEYQEAKAAGKLGGAVDDMVNQTQAITSAAVEVAHGARIASLTAARTVETVQEVVRSAERVTRAFLAPASLTTTPSTATGGSGGVGPRTPPRAFLAPTNGQLLADAAIAGSWGTTIEFNFHDSTISSQRAVDELMDQVVTRLRRDARVQL